MVKGYSPSPDIELEDLPESEEAAPSYPTPELFRDPEPVQLDAMDEAEEAVQEHPGREHLNKSFKFRDPEQLNEESQTDTKQGQLMEGSQEREDLRIAYRKYILTRQRIATIEEQLRTHGHLWFVILLPYFFEPQTGLAGALEEQKML